MSVKTEVAAVADSRKTTGVLGVIALLLGMAVVLDSTLFGAILIVIGVLAFASLAVPGIDRQEAEALEVEGDPSPAHLEVGAGPDGGLRARSPR